MNEHEQERLREQLLDEADRDEDERRVRQEINLVADFEARYRMMLELARSQGHDGPEVDWLVQQHQQMVDTLELLARYGRAAL